jgi:UDP-glucose 4-epimerase
VVHGDGSQSRDYVYVDDVVSAMVAASTSPNVDGMVINIGSGIATNVQELVKYVLSITEGQPELLYNPKIAGGVSRLTADISLAQEKLSFHPSIKLIDGLRLTLRDSRLGTECMAKPCRLLL